MERSTGGPYQNSVTLNVLGISLDRMTAGLRVLQKETDRFSPESVLYEVSKTMVNRTPKEVQNRVAKLKHTARSMFQKRIFVKHIGTLWAILRHASEPGSRDYLSKSSDEFFGVLQNPNEGVLALLYKVENKTPLWFRKLPTLTVFMFVSFVIRTRLESYLLSMQVSDDDEAQLRKIQEHWATLSKEAASSTHQRHAVFKGFFNEFLKKKVKDTIPVWEGGQSLLDEVPDSVKEQVNASLKILEDLDRLFPLAAVLNCEEFNSTREAWKSEVGNLSSPATVLRYPSDDTKLFYDNKRTKWLSAMKVLGGKDVVDELYGLASTYLLYNELAKTVEDGDSLLAYHGTKIGSVYVTRCTVLQTQISSIWNALVEFTDSSVFRVVNTECLKASDKGDVSTEGLVQKIMGGVSPATKKICSPLFSSLWMMSVLLEEDGKHFKDTCVQLLC